MRKASESFTIKGAKKVRVYQCTLPLYSFAYYIYVGQDMKELGKAGDLDWPGANISGGISPNTTAYACEVTHPENGLGVMIFMNANMIHSSMSILSILVHECLHMSWYMLDNIGLEIDADNHEAQTYILQELFQEGTLCIQDYCKRYRLKPKNLLEPK